MIEPQSDTLRLTALLLHYPDETLFGSLEDIAALAADRPKEAMTAAILSFVRNLREKTPLRAQEDYTAAFDMYPATTLNMTYHLYGDNEKRAAALVRLQNAYDRAGWERITGELPDYLPMMLEFLAVCHEPRHAAPVWESMQGIGRLITGLESKAPAYAALLQPLAAQLGPPRAILE